MSSELGNYRDNMTALRDAVGLIEAGLVVEGLRCLNELRAHLSEHPDARSWISLFPTIDALTQDCVERQRRCAGLKIAA
jgi:hypothetical protein